MFHEDFICLLFFVTVTCLPWVWRVCIPYVHLPDALGSRPCEIRGDSRFIFLIHFLLLRIVWCVALFFLLPSSCCFLFRSRRYCFLLFLVRALPFSIPGSFFFLFFSLPPLLSLSTDPPKIIPSCSHSVFFLLGPPFYIFLQNASLATFGTSGILSNFFVVNANHKGIVYNVLSIFLFGTAIQQNLLHGARASASLEGL